MDGLNWNDVRDLARRVAQGEPFLLTDVTRSMLLQDILRANLAALDDEP
ncbi:hypothetical protein ACLEPN_25335 [Myxococcus sp. 1LA]